MKSEEFSSFTVAIVCVCLGKCWTFAKQNVQRYLFLFLEVCKMGDEKTFLRSWQFVSFSTHFFVLVKSVSQTYICLFPVIVYRF